MNKITVFGKPGSGKSTFSKRLSGETGIPLHPLDSIAYHPNGQAVDRETYDRAHEAILASPRWIIDGLGPIGSFYTRLEAADTLIYIDLPYPVSYRWVTKRLIKGAVVRPEGWPRGSDLLKGTLQSYKMLRLSPQFWNSAFEARLSELEQTRKVVIIRSARDLRLMTAADLRD